MASERPAKISGKRAGALSRFTPATREWFLSAFSGPTPVQEVAWEAIGAGDNALVIAPTGSGKTLAAFLHAIDTLFVERGVRLALDERPLKSRTEILYISPLKALAADVRRNLGVPLDGVSALREARGDPAVTVSVGMRTGDTPAGERAALVRRPPDILITTPESLYLMLTSKARESLRSVRAVIIDEVHAVAGTKRGAHLALSLERLDALLSAPAQRIGLSATVRPEDKVAAFLGGAHPVTVVNPVTPRRLAMRIEVPLEDMTDLAAPVAGAETQRPVGRGGSIWHHVESAILDRVLACRSTIVFVNSRGLAERMTARLNDLYTERFGLPQDGTEQEPGHYLSSNMGTENRTNGSASLIARAHHGSVSRERRNRIEADLKSGDLRCVVATSSLELGIDMGEVDLVIQVAAPPSVSSGLQRVGRAGHHVGGTPSGLVYPRTRRDLVDATVTVECMLDGRIEAVSPPRNPLDILAQQTVAAVAMDPLQVDAWYATVRRSDPFRGLSRKVFDATLDMLAGRYPSDDFSEFRPRLVWDRATGVLTARPGAQRLAVVNGGTIPDRGTYRVVLPEGEEQAGSRCVGELDEEMVHESRINDVITLGATSWRIREITTDQVLVVPAPGRSARLPFWHGEGPGRPAELGEAVGSFLRMLDQAGGPTPEVRERLQRAGLDSNAATNLLNLLADQRASTGTLPTDINLVVERCRDEVGDWRVMLHSPFGRRVHAPWALAVADRIRRRYGVDGAVMAADDGIVARVPDTEGYLPGPELFLFDADDLKRLVTDSVGTSALFAARFRECAARALLLPRRSPGRRSPLWQQRLRARQLLEVAREHRDFPILVETARECLQDVYDLPALYGVMQRIGAGAIRLADVGTETPSPFASNLLFGYVAEFMYQDDAPLAERRASLLALDSDLLRDLMGETGFEDLLDAAVVARVEAELQHTAEDRRVSGVEGVADLLRELGPLSTAEVAARLAPSQGEPNKSAEEADQYLAALAESGRAFAVQIAGTERWAAVEDAARLRDALGVVVPDTVPAVFLEPVTDPLRDLVVRFARSHALFSTEQAARRYGLGVAVAGQALEALHEQGRLMRGDFGLDLRSGESENRPEVSPAVRQQWVWEDVFRRLRVRSLQAAREATRPVDTQAYVRLVLERQNLISAGPGSVGQGEFFGRPHGLDGVARAVEQLAGLALPASLWEGQILPARVPDYAPAMLDELIAAGEVIWTGSERLGDGDGLVALHLRDLAPETLPEPGPVADLSPMQHAIIDILADGGAYFASRIADLVRLEAGGGEALSPALLRDALWGLAWSGRVSTDGWAALRALNRAQGSGQQRPLRSNRTVRRRINGAYRTYSFTSKLPPTMPAVATQDPALAGRWFLVPHVEIAETARILARAESLLDRYGVVTRGTAIAEVISGGFPALQRVYRNMEDSGRLLRGRFVEGLGAAQFAETATINHLRVLADTPQAPGQAVALSAADPANPFGAAIPWPNHAAKTRPTRHAAALVVISGGRLILWLAQGGRRLLTFVDAGETDAAEALRDAVFALAESLRRGTIPSFTVESVDDMSLERWPFASVLRDAGFSVTPRGLCWYGKIGSAPVRPPR